MDIKVRPAMQRLFALAATAAGLAGCLPGAAVASGQLASDRSCYNCHGDPPRRNMPTFGQLAARYAKYRDDPAAQLKLADKLRDGSIFSHIDAHERLSEEDALRLIRWIAEGAQ